MTGNVNNGIDDLSRYTFGHFGERVKQLKFLQKYTDPGTETNLQPSANVLVANSVNISAWQSLLFIRAVHALTSKISCVIFGDVYILSFQQQISQAELLQKKYISRSVSHRKLLPLAVILHQSK